LSPARIDLDQNAVQITFYPKTSKIRFPMQISVSDAKGRLTELVRRAEAGEEVILTRHGRAAVCLVRAKAPVDLEARHLLLTELSAAGRAKGRPRESAARSQDFLYDDEGLPR
jgi:prevent-host-death family protein